MTDRELDALVAEKVMGWEQRWSCEDDGHDRWVRRAPLGAPYEWEFAAPLTWSPSRDIGAAWEVAEKMRGEGHELHFYAGPDCDPCEASFEDWKDTVSADTAPRAICLAALRAVGVAVA